MQSPVREEVVVEVLGAAVRVEAPEPLATWLRRVGEPLPGNSAGSTADEERWTAVPHPVRAVATPEGWLMDRGEGETAAATAEEALLRLQELIVEMAAARRGDSVLLRGSLAARGSQRVLLVGDPAGSESMLAVALTTVGFRLVSVGLAPFDGDRLTALPLGAAFRLDEAERANLRTLGVDLETDLECLSPGLFRPRVVTAAAEPTHVLFVERHAGSLSLLRPISATAARTRLCNALLVAPEDRLPFAVVAELLRHTRGIHLTLGDVPRALELLGRLLPHWEVA